jgi:hypothetical protein
MSTRGLVGIGTPEHFQGRENPRDSYPTHLGREVWATAQRFLHNDRHLHGFAQRLLRGTDWPQVAHGGRCPYCGQITGTPHSISAELILPAHDSPDASLAEDLLVAAPHPLDYPDPTAQYHAHDSHDPDDFALTPESIDWLFTEWAYLVDPDRQLLQVLVGCIPTPITYQVEIIRPNGTRERWQDKPRYTSALVGSYDLLGPEPDWDTVEMLGNTIHDQREATFAAHPQHPLLDAVRARAEIEVWDQRDPAIP